MTVHSILPRLAQPAVVITFPEAGTLRSRRVVSRSRARPTGKYPSWKMARMVQWESHNELNAYRLLDASPLVKSFREQPAEIRYVLDGEEHRHYPDTLVELPDGKEFWEIKPRREAFSPEVARRTELLARELPGKGYAYRMVLAEDLARQPRLDNVLTILKFGRPAIDPVDRERMRVAFSPGSELTWNDAVSSERGGNARGVVCRLLLEGVLVLDVEQPLSPATLLRWANGLNPMSRLED